VTVLNGNQRGDGLEMGATGNLTKQLEIPAGYTYLDGKTIASGTPTLVGKQLANTARNAVNLWTADTLTSPTPPSCPAMSYGMRWPLFASTGPCHCN
jgi:catecholate siderophore receptor